MNHNATPSGLDGITLEKILAVKKMLDANPCKSTMWYPPTYSSIKAAAKTLGLSRKRIRQLQLRGSITIAQ